MIRARRACFVRLLPLVAIFSSRPRCSSETSKSTPVRIVPPLVCPRCSRAVPASLVKESNELNKPLDYNRFSFDLIKRFSNTRNSQICLVSQSNINNYQMIISFLNNFA